MESGLPVGAAKAGFLLVVAWWALFSLPMLKHVRQSHHRGDEKLPSIVGAFSGLFTTLKKIRDHLVAEPAAWKRAISNKRFREVYELEGDTLKRPPRGYDPEHALVEDLKRKDFTGATRLRQSDVTSPDFLDQYAKLCRAATPFMRYLCAAVGVPY